MRERVKMKEEGYSRSVPMERMTRGEERSQEPETSNPKLKTLTAKLAWRKLRTVTIAHVHPSAQSLTPHLPCLWGSSTQH
jgi:hypothetical protein